MHLSMRGYLVADDTKVRLGQLLRTAGDTLSFLYDLGDCWCDLRLTPHPCQPARLQGRASLAGFDINNPEPP